MADEYSFTIYGTRGTHPVCGAKFRRYGGHTTCFTMRAPGGLLMFDAGTGAIQPDGTHQPTCQSLFFYASAP